MDNSRYKEYISFLMKYRDELSVYLENESEKRRALLDNRLDRLETMLKIQQAETMKFRGMEAKRTKLQSGLGLPDVKAKELLASIDDSEARSIIEVLYSEIADTASRIHEQNKQSLELAKVNLKVFDLITRGEVSEAQSKFYGPDSGSRKAYSTGDAFEETV